MSPSTTVSTPYFSRYLQTKTRSLKSADRRYEIVHCYDRIIDKTRYTNVFPRKGEKQYTMSVLSVLNMPWPQSKSNINDDSTQRCNLSICVYFCSVHKNPLLYMQSLRSVWRQVKNTQAIEWKPYIIPHPKPNHINEFTFKNFFSIWSAQIAPVSLFHGLKSDKTGKFDWKNFYREFWNQLWSCNYMKKLMKTNENSNDTLTIYDWTTKSGTNNNGQNYG